MPSRAAQSVPFAPASRAPRRSWLRPLAVVALVALLHLLGGVWFARREAAPPSPKTPPLRVTLIPLAPIGDTPAKQRLTPRPPPRRRAKSPGRAVTARHKPSASPVRPSPAPSPLSPPVAGEQTTLGSTSAPQAPSPAPAGPRQPRQGGGTPFAPPPSADLEYDTFVNGVRNQTGVIRWHDDGSHYSLQVAIPLLFVGIFSYSSEGGFDAYGIAPARYTERRGRHAPAVTSFVRGARPEITFSKVATALPLPAGAQDRFSMVFELASLARGDPRRYSQPGATQAFYIADTDSGEIWPIEYVGPETMPGPGGYLETRHFTRLARRADDRRKIDVWLAPALDWLPVRIRQTEPDGSEFDLVLRRLGTATGATANEPEAGTGAPVWESTFKQP